MIRCIAVIDEARGLADDQGVPWQSKTPQELQYFRRQTLHSDIVMGYNTYQSLPAALPERTNYVLVRNAEPLLREGFVAVTDLDEFLQAHPDVWIIGGAGLFGQTIGLADELYITQLEGTYGCTRFFPEWQGSFTLASRSDPQTESGITYRFEIWHRKTA